MPPAPSGPAGATVRDFVQLIRPTQWIKNIVVLAGPIAALTITSLPKLVHAAGAFVAFCLVASSAYVINDICDRKNDARHPTKRNRPIARGVISVGFAGGLSAFLFLAGVTTGAAVNRMVMAVLIVYFVMTVLYSVALKRRVILDVVVVALGFVLRAWAGVLAVGVVASHWFVACVFTLCLFMGFGKRRCEIAMIGDLEEAGQHRKTLLRYTPDLLNHLITVSAGIAIITFLLYTMDTAAHPAAFPKQHLFYTLPIVIYGVFRYAMITEMGKFSGPTEIVLNDRPLLFTVLLWTVCAVVIAYQDRIVEGGFSALLAS